MKRTFTFLFASLFLCFVAWAQQIESIADLNNNSVYTINSQDRGYLYYDANNGDYVTSSSHTNLTDDTPTGVEAEQFAFLRTDETAEGEYYLYSVSASKFATWTSNSGVKLELTAEPVCTWKLSAAGDLFVIMVPNTTNTCINVTNWQAHHGVKVVGTGADGGNKMEIVKVNAEVNLSAAVAKITALESSEVELFYVYKYKGTEKLRETVTATKGEAYPAPASRFGIAYTMPEGNVAEDAETGQEVEIVCTSALPFEYIESIDDFEQLSTVDTETGNWMWYYLTIGVDGGKRFLYHNEDLDHLPTDKNTYDEANEDAYSWAFVGNPFDGFMVVNKATGNTHILSSSTTMAGNNGEGTWPIMTATPISEGNNEYWTLSSSTHAEGGFFMAQKGFAANRMNNRSKLAYWTGGADQGSTFMVERRLTEAQKLAALVPEAEALYEKNKWNYAEEPALGEYSEDAVTAFKAAIDAEDKTIASIKAAILEFEKSKNLPLFTIDAGYADYALGKSIFENEAGGLQLKTTDVTDNTMLWAFDMTSTKVGVTEKVVVRNVATGNLFWGADFIKVTETNENDGAGIADDDIFLFYKNGTGDPVHAQNGWWNTPATVDVITYGSREANSGSAWKFTFVGVSNPAAYDLSEVKEEFAAQVAAFEALGEEEAFTVLEDMRNNWSMVNGRMQGLAEAIEAGDLVLKSEVKSAMNQMTGYFAVPEAYAAYKVAEAEADSVLVGLKDMELAEEDATAYATLQGTVAMMQEAFPWASSAMDISNYKGMLEQATAPFYAIDEAVEGSGEVVWVEIPAGGNEIYQADLSGLEYWTSVGNTNFSIDKGAMEFVAGENTEASLIQEGLFTEEGTYRLTGKAFHKGAVNAVMFVGDQKVAVEEAEDADASYENADRDFYGENKYTTPSVEFTVVPPYEGAPVYINVGYSCEFNNAEDLFVVGALKLEKKQVNSVTLKDKFEQVLGLDSENGFAGLGFYATEYFTSFAEDYTELLNKSVMPIVTALQSGKKVLKHKMANAIEEMEAMLAEVTPLIEYVQSPEYLALTESAATIRDGFYEQSNAYALLDKALLAAMGVVFVEEEIDGEVVATPKYYAAFTSVADIEKTLEPLEDAITTALAQIPDAITLDEEEAELSDDMPTIKLTATVTAESENADKSVFWESDDEDVATVDENGLVTAVAEGTAYITAYSIHKKYYAECEVTVTALTDGIDNFEVKVETVIYDIHGRQVEKMEKGFYIVNGKKVLVK